MLIEQANVYGIVYGLIAFDIKRTVFMRLYAGATMYAALGICYAINIGGMCDDIQ